jgi:hypothetical protein
MTFWYAIGGAFLLLLGVLLWIVFLAATVFSVGFGGTPIAAPWYLIPAVVTFGGPILLWYVLPKRRRAKRGDR